MKDWTEIEYSSEDLEVEILNLMSDEEFEEHLRKVYESKNK